jgi:hypothetical protein
MKTDWRIDAGRLKTLRGMIIDRDKAWRADPEMAPVIDAAMRAGLPRIDEATYSRIYWFLRYGPIDEDGARKPLAGSYETHRHDDDQMKVAWRQYKRRHGIVVSKVST